MKLRFFANACCSYEKAGFKLLCDPWLVDGAFDSWCHFPPLITKLVDLAGYDAVYISHLHPDHLDPATILGLNPNIDILTLKNSFGFLQKILRSHGFKNIREIEDGETIQCGPFSVTMYAPFQGVPFHDSELGNLIDSAIVVESGNTSALNTNDNLPSLSAAKKLSKRHGRFTVAQLNYNAAGPYPSCFLNLTDTQKMEAHNQILLRNLTNMAQLADEFSPQYVMPFAGDYVLGGSQHRKNRYLGTTTRYEAARFLKKHKHEPLLLDEGQAFDLETGQYDRPSLPEPTNEERQKYVSETLSKIRYRWEAPGYAKQDATLRNRLLQARQKLIAAQERFKCFPDCNFYLQVNFYPSNVFTFNFASKSDLGSFVSSASKLKKPYLYARMHPGLLDDILDKKAHWNNAEIGCHVDFYRYPDKYLPDVHTLLSFFHT